MWYIAGRQILRFVMGWSTSFRRTSFNTSGKCWRGLRQRCYGLLCLPRARNHYVWLEACCVTVVLFLICSAMCFGPEPSCTTIGEGCNRDLLPWYVLTATFTNLIAWVVLIGRAAHPYLSLIVAHDDKYCFR